MTPQGRATSGAETTPSFKAIIAVRPGSVAAAIELFRDALGVSVTPYATPTISAAPAGIDGDQTARAISLPDVNTIISDVTDREFDRLQSAVGSGIIDAVYRDWVVTTPRLSTVASWRKAATPTPWALKQMQVSASGPTGQGVRVAILDSGFDASRSGFGGPDVVPGTAVSNRSIDDTYGHGTHCAGLVGGGSDAHGNRFGVAPQAELHCCKVMYGQVGAASDLITGIQWAIGQRCHVVLIAQEFTTAAARQVDFDHWGKAALAAGALLIAAAGNQGPNGTVRLPGAAESVIAVGATSETRRVLQLSSPAGSSVGAEVDVVAPGDDIYSAGSGGGYLNLSGTSMAAAHAAGVAALWVEHKGVTGMDLWTHLKGTAQTLAGINVAIAGNGIVMAP